MSRNAIAGGLLWIGLVAGSALSLFSLNTIDLLFLLAPLIAVPLGLALALRVVNGEKDSLGHPKDWPWSSFSFYSNSKTSG
jgi:hypothetical protein